MTELMKRYEAETGKDATYRDIARNGLQYDFISPDYYFWCAKKIDHLEKENAQLKAQLTWRPVSEPPKENVDVEVCDMSKPSLDEREPVIAYYEKGEWICVFPYNFDVYAYITPTHWRYIPPAPEGE